MQKQSLIQWGHRLYYWYRMFAGTSYYHQRQGAGRLFIEGRLEGYFNDLTGKTNWRGTIDRDGLPLLDSSGQSSPLYFPILLCQKALGHWDVWLGQGSAEDRRCFLQIAHWLRANQDAEGGWDTWGLYGQRQQYCYSAMTQGQALSVMTRAYRLTRDGSFERACRSAMVLMRKPIQDGGVCWYEAGDVFLEEFPSPSRETVLNGWIFALFGVYDYLLQFSDDQVQSFYAETSASLARGLAEYDAGFWSYYNSGRKRLASPFYHRLHLGQLAALSEVMNEPSVKLTLAAWVRYEKNWFNKSRAILVKGLQKMREPGEVPIVRRSKRAEPIRC
jgi:heparosan-N-sulfate-glucuronate 5-epimerase